MSDTTAPEALGSESPHARVATRRRLVRVARALDNFAWSMVQCSTPQAQRRLSKLREDLRDALADYRHGSRL